MKACGHEATARFAETHGEGLRFSLRLLNQFFIGDAEGYESAPVADPNDPPPPPEFLTVMRDITAALHTFDEARATGEAHGLMERGPLPWNVEREAGDEEGGSRRRRRKPVKKAK